MLPRRSPDDLEKKQSQAGRHHVSVRQHSEHDTGVQDHLQPCHRQGTARPNPKTNSRAGSRSHTACSHTVTLCSGHQVSLLPENISETFVETTQLHLHLQPQSLTLVHGCCLPQRLRWLPCAGQGRVSSSLLPCLLSTPWQLGRVRPEGTAGTGFCHKQPEAEHSISQLSMGSS